jgi:hypothetical protein
VTLKPNDRIVFGTSSVILFKHDLKQQDASRVDNIDNVISYEFVMKEIQDATKKPMNPIKEKMRQALEANLKKM